MNFHYEDHELNAMTPQQLVDLGVIPRAMMLRIPSGEPEPYTYSCQVGWIQSIPLHMDRLMKAARKEGGGERKVIARALQLSGGKLDPMVGKDWIAKNGSCDDWGADWMRGSADVGCVKCGKPLRHHVLENGPGYGFCGDEVLYLMRDCLNRLWKP